jgi:glycosyltransferase involved in cell wall biosynthesis
MTIIIHAVTSSLSVNLMRGQLSYLREQGFDVNLISSNGKELIAAEHNERVRILPVNIVREISPFSDILSLIKLIYLINKIKPCLTNVSTPKAGLLGGIASWTTRVPIRIYTMRGLRFETASGWKRRLLILMEKISCGCAHKVICISNSMREQAIEYKLTTPDKIIILGSGSSNGIDISRFKKTVILEKAIEDIRTHLGILSTSIIIGFVGRLTKDKGIVELLEAYKSLQINYPQIKLLLVGDFEDGDSLGDFEKDWIKQDKNILNVGFVSDPVPYYYLMNMLAFPTYREGFGNASLEAAAAGVPVVTTNATGAIDTVVDGLTGYIVPVGNVERLTGALRMLLENKSLAKQMGQHGLERVETDFQSVKIWSELADLYKKMISR